MTPCTGDCNGNQHSRHCLEDQLRAANLQNEAMRAALEHIVGTPSQEPVIMGIASIARHGLRYTLKQEDGNAKEES